MRKFRNLYYKLIILLCIFATFFFLFDVEKRGVGYSVFYMFVGLLSFGSFAVGKGEIDPDKPIRNILTALGWSLVGFGMMALGITMLKERPENANDSLIIMFLALGLMLFIVLYIIHIIKHKQWLAIISLGVFIVGAVFIGFGQGTTGAFGFILDLLGLLTVLASFGLFIFSLIKDAIEE